MVLITFVFVKFPPGLLHGDDTMCFLEAIIGTLPTKYIVEI